MNKLLLYRYHIEQKMPDTKEYMQCDSICMQFKKTNKMNGDVCQKNAYQGEDII